MLDYIQILVELKRVTAKSQDPHKKVGCLIFNKFEILVTGCNTFPQNIEHLEDRLLRPDKYDYLEHAERNAIYKAARLGIPINGLSMAITSFPCVECARAIIEAGIVKLFYTTNLDPNSKWYESQIKSNRMLLEAKVEIKLV